MEVKTRLRYGVMRRKCNQIKKANPKIDRNESLRKVSNILKKKESLRSAEEKAVLAKMTDVVREVNVRIFRRERIIQRNKEVEDDYVVLKSKCKKLAHALQRAKHLVVYTGAGISTAADIPDYRGPNGIWTLLQQGKKIEKHDLTQADPTSTHMALWQLYRKRYLKFIVSQNCDGLHLRSGLPRRALSEVHGNMYIEICRECKPNVQYWRLFDTTERTARFSHKTGRLCHKCGSGLVDSIVHFGERGVAQWPLNWAGALHHAAKADVILCLGSSLKVLKKYPWLWAMDRPIKKRPAIFIVNLQWTPKDDVAQLKINGKCDIVMKLVMEYLGLETPKYDRDYDPIFVHASILSPKELHTTTHPILLRKPPDKMNTKDDSSKAIKNDENSLVKKEDTDTSVHDVVPGKAKANKNMDIDEDEEDCPLNILKMKIASDNPIPEDLSIKRENDECKPQMFEHESDTKMDCKITKKDDLIEKSINLEQTDRVICVSKQEIKKSDGTIVKMKTADFSCTVNVEEKNVSTKIDHVKDITNQSNLKINAIINNTCHLKSRSIESPDGIEMSRVEGISMEILAEEFERVHIEMKTNENEIHQVSILLVNKTKLSPKSCDKFQQTDPEITDQTYSETKERIPPDLKLLDTGQNSIENVPIKTELVPAKRELDDEDSKLNMNMNNHCITPNGSLHKILSCSSELSKVLDNKPVNSLRNFRRIKEIKKETSGPVADIIKIPSFNKYFDTSKSNGISVIKNEVNVSQLMINSFLLNNPFIERPIDYSFNFRVPQDPCIRIPKFVPERTVNHSCILKIPKPPLLHTKNILSGKKIESKRSESNCGVDISGQQKPSAPLRCIENNVKRSDLTLDNKIRKPCVVNGEIKVIKAQEDFSKQCEMFAKAIIQRALKTSHEELQSAYSGIHSIINPIPFNVQYDFKSNFSALKFIELGQRLISKNRRNNLISKHNDNSKKSEVIKKRRPLNRPRFVNKRRDPQCKFCYEQYKSYLCNFYISYDSENRFEKYVKNKLVVCDCCSDTETSSESSDDDISLMERKRRFEAKIAGDSTESEQNGKTTNGNVLSNGDLKNSVQNSIKDNSESSDCKNNTAQAGWFGKGYRKNRRKKR